MKRPFEGIVNMVRQKRLEATGENSGKELGQRQHRKEAREVWALLNQEGSRQGEQ